MSLNVEEGPRGVDYTIAGVKVPFPLRAYPCQISLMERVISAASRGENALLESPTGTGKTLALLASSIAWMNSCRSQGQSAKEPLLRGDSDRKNTPCHRIIYATRTHSQIAQVVGELKRVQGTFHSAVLASREHLCLYDRETFETGTSVDEGCAKALKNKSCSYFHKSERVVEEVKSVVWDIEDLWSAGRKVKGCPFYASRGLAKEADVLLCPYNYLVDPIIRKAMSIEVESALVIFDEAHNIEDVCREALSLHTTRETLKHIVLECEALGKRGILRESHLGMRKMMMGVISLMEGMGRPLETPSHNRESVSKYATTGMHLLKLLSVEQIQEAVIRSFSMYLTEAKELVRVLQNEKKGDVVSVGDHPLLSYRKVLPGGQSHVPECLSMRAIVSLEKIELVLRSFFSHPNDFYMELSHVEKRRRNGIVHDCNMDVGCLNPALAFQDLSDQSHSIMLASGTLSPMNTFGSELGCVFPKKLEARHVIQKDQVECMCIPKGVKGSSLTSSFRAGGDLAMTTDLGETLVGLTRVIPHGMLFFFPSFQKLETTLSRWMESGLWNRIEEHKEIFSEPRHARSLDKVIRGYEERVDHSVKGESRGAILFAVFRGKISEGIDFSDAKARAVICFGIPFPNVKEEAVAKKKQYNDGERKFGKLSGAEWYRQQAFRALNQALGRCIRHKNDFGAILLLEERMREPRNLSSLSKWLRERVRVWDEAHEALEHLSRYFSSKPKDEPSLSSFSRPKTEAVGNPQATGLFDEDKRKEDDTHRSHAVTHPPRSRCNKRKIEIEMEAEIEIEKKWEWIPRQKRESKTKHVIPKGDSADIGPELLFCL